MNWKEFDEKVLRPFEKKGDEAGAYGGYANVFNYTQAGESK